MNLFFYIKYYLLRILVVLILFSISIKTISMVITQETTPDGAINAQISKNVAYSHKYGIPFNNYYKMFPPAISTGPTVLLPAAVLFKLFGVNFVVAQITSGIYLLFFIFSVIYFLKFCVKAKDIYVILFLLFFYGTEKIFYFGLGLVGEIPMLFYIIMASIFLSKFEENGKLNYLFLCGMFIGFGIITKTICIIALPAISFALIWHNFFKQSLRNNWGKSILNKFVILFGGIVIPFFIFEIYKIIYLGFYSYTQWWNVYINLFFSEAGILQNYQDTNGFLGKILIHLNLLSKNLKINEIAIVFALFYISIVLIVFVFRKDVKLRKHKKLEFFQDTFVQQPIVFLFVTTILYFLWYFFFELTSRAVWYRRIIPGVILSEISLMLGFIYLEKFFTESFVQILRKKYFNIFAIRYTLIVLLFFASLYKIVISKNYLVSTDISPNVKELIESKKIIDTLPVTASIYLANWSLAPNVVLLVNRSFGDINSKELSIIGSLTDKYLLRDKTRKQEDDVYERILKNYSYTEIISNNQCVIYSLNRRQKPGTVP